MKRFCATALVLLLTLGALAAGKSGTIVYINGSKYYIHTVQPGETLYALSKAYEVGEKVILENNPEAAGGLKAGSNVRIPFVAQRTEQLSEKKLRKTFSAHTVAKGETLYAISRRYQIAIPVIVEDNPNLDPVHLKLGEQILLRKLEIGHEDEAGSKEQWEQYRKSLNSVADDGYAYHIVHPGETFYALSHRFGITEEELSKLNNGLKAADLKAGAMVKVPKKAGEETVAGPAEHPHPAQPEEVIVEEKHKVKEIEFRALRPGEVLDIALMLPLATTGDANGNYLEFYQGFLLGMDSLRHSGHSANVTLYNTGRDPEKIRQIVESDEFRATDLVIGPVYEEGLHPVILFAEQNRIPVVSPLANVTGMNSDALFQLAPVPSLKYEKAAGLIGSGKQVTLIYSGATDKEFENEVLALIGNTDYDRHEYKYVHPSRSASSQSDLTPLVGNGLDNVFIVMAANEVDVERILAALASADTNLTARGRTAPRFTVLGNARWNRFNNIDRTMFFKDRVTFISTYHAKRDSQAVSNFDSAYIRAFGTMPTLYSYRGYDAAMIFGPAMYDDIQYDMQGRTYTPLQTTYRFGQGSESRNHVNQNWMRVTYNNDYTITVE